MIDRISSQPQTADSERITGTRGQERFSKLLPQRSRAGDENSSGARPSAVELAVSASNPFDPTPATAAPIVYEYAAPNRKNAGETESFAADFVGTVQRSHERSRPFDAERSSNGSTRRLQSLVAGSSESRSSAAPASQLNARAMPALAVSRTPNPFNPTGEVTLQSTRTTAVDTVPDTRTESERFNDAYWAHFPAEVQALRDMPQGKSREDAAKALAKAGHVIDVPIHAWGWDPWKVMNLRQQYGMQFVPSALMAPEPPGQEVPGAIRVSLSVADYPAYPGRGRPGGVSG